MGLQPSHRCSAVTTACNACRWSGTRNATTDVKPSPVQLLHQTIDGGLGGGGEATCADVTDTGGGGCKGVRGFVPLAALRLRCLRLRPALALAALPPPIPSPAARARLRRRRRALLAAVSVPVSASAPLSLTSEVLSEVSSSKSIPAQPRRGREKEEDRGGNECGCIGMTRVDTSRGTAKILLGRGEAVKGAGEAGSSTW
jgi:hypothetical protein